MLCCASGFFRLVRIDKRGRMDLAAGKIGTMLVAPGVAEWAQVRPEEVAGIGYFRSLNVRLVTTC